MIRRIGHDDISCDVSMMTFLSFVLVLQLIIGRIYPNNCSLNWHLNLLVLAILVGLSIIVLNIIKAILPPLAIRPTMRAAENNSATVTTGRRILSYIIIFIIESVCDTLLIWFFVGSFWIFSVWIRNRVQYTRPENQADYCHSIVFRSTFWLVLLFPILLVLSIYVACILIRKHAKKCSQAVPITES
jgi:hypothetical protein